MKLIVKAYKKPVGSWEFPAKTCRDLKMTYPETTDGTYVVDPNRGSAHDAFIAECRFTDTVSETCVSPKMETFNKQKWVRSGQDGFRWFVEELNADIGKITYPSSRSQFAFLRMEHTHAHQNMTYHCKNSHAHQDSKKHVKSYVKVMTNSEVEMTTASKNFHLKVVTDGCTVKDGKWHKTEFDMKPKDMTHLPISDVAVYDVADEDEEFGLDVGPICFQ